MTKHADNFNSGSLAGTWRQQLSTWAVVSAAVECMDIAGSSGKYLIDDALDVGGSDMYTELRTQSTQVNSGTNTGPGIRHRMVDVTGYQFATNFFTDSHGLWRTMLGIEAQMGSVSAPLAQGDMVRIEAAGRTLRYKINDALVALLQDTMITNGQRGCINGYNGAGGDLIRADDYETGLLTDDLVAPFIAEWTPQVEGATSGAVITPSFTDVRTGDEALVHVVTRDAAVTVTAPAGEGWSASIQTPSQTGLRTYVFAKRWGLGGQSDDTTPTFTISTGTAGWVAAGLVIRNPLHATAPWATATQAIVASGSQSNASSTTVTAPSVSHVGTHVTVLRLFSSADDNALNAPSAGVLIYGGAAFDSTQGNDEAQAASIVEDVTLAANTGTATVTESAVGPDISNGITLVFAIPSSSLGTTTETDTAVGIVLAGKSTALGSPGTETDTARAISFAQKAQTLAAGGAETDSTSALAGAGKATAAGVATSAESAPALAGAAHTTTVASTTETDTGQPLAGASKATTVGAATSSEQALALAGQTLATDVAAATETDTALALAGAVKATLVGTAAEVDGAPPLDQPVLTPAGETDAAVALAGATKTTSVGAAAETDQALALVIPDLGSGAETDGAPALGAAAKATDVGMAAGMESALPLAGSLKTTTLGLAAETDTALPVIVLPPVRVPSQGTYDPGGGGRRTYSPGDQHLYDGRGRGYVYDS